jgi:hypothetical protein
MRTGQFAYCLLAWAIIAVVIPTSVAAQTTCTGASVGSPWVFSRRGQAGECEREQSQPGRFLCDYNSMFTAESADQRELFQGTRRHRARVSATTTATTWAGAADYAPCCSSSSSDPTISVGSRARASDGAAVGRARRARMARAAKGSRTVPMTRRRPWHFGHS